MIEPDSAFADEDRRPEIGSVFGEMIIESNLCSIDGLLLRHGPYAEDFSPRRVDRPSRRLTSILNRTTKGILG
ncbi:hypothetical protein BH10PLA2_BH10PLA2_26640 [soil metagenome]